MAKAALFFGILSILSNRIAPWLDKRSSRYGTTASVIALVAGVTAIGLAMGAIATGVELRIEVISK